jgi:hypothetical protein
MAATNFTPIILYHSTTVAATPSAGNLNNGELAINITDGKLFYKDNLGAVQTIASTTGAAFTWPGAGIANSTGSSWGTSYSTTGSGTVVALATSPALVTPDLGTPSAGNLSNCTALSLSTGVSGTLPVGNGGTGITAGTSGGIPYFSATNTIASSAALTASALVIGGGAGVAPSTTTTGTGVLTAIGNAVNTANGLVTQTATLTSSALLLGGGSGTGISSTTTGTGVVTAVGIAVNTNGGVVTQSGTLTASALLIGGGASTAISSTTTGTGVLTALGNNANASGGFTTINGTATLTNKRIDPRVSSAASASTLDPDISAFDQYAFTALASALQINAPTGTPVDGNRLIFRLLDDGTSRALTWNGTYTPIGVTLPTSTTISKTTYVGCIYNANNTRWDVVAVTTQA